MLKLFMFPIVAVLTLMMLVFNTVSAAIVQNIVKLSKKNLLSPPYVGVDR